MFLLAAAVALQLATTKASQPAPIIYHGRQSQTTVGVPKITAEIKVDGNLDEAAWQQASVLTGFSQYAPVDGAVAEDSTEVLVWYTEHEIYFGIRAFEPHGAVNATLADRDKYFSNDFVHILLDTFNDKRRAFIFGVNPLGVQGDGVLSESPTSSEDYTPDYIFQSKGKVTDYGYQVEIRIPFKSMGYSPARVQDWGIQVIRRVQHSGHDQTWTQVKRGTTSFLNQNGTLKGLTELKRGLVMDITPVMTTSLRGAPVPGSSFEYGKAEPEFGGNLRWGVTTNLTLNATVNPDFSQVESDAGQTVFDPRQALFFPEKRPFFLESVEQLTAPRNLIYTRRIVSPVGAIKFTGKMGRTNIGFLSAMDDDAQSATGEDNPLYNILRIKRDVGKQNTVGLVYTDKMVGDDYNRVAGIDGRFTFNKEYTVFVQAAGSFWRTGTNESKVPLWQFGVSRNSRAFGWNVNMDGVHEEFVAGAGFLSRPGIAHSNTGLRFSRFGDKDAKLQSYTFNPLIDNTWDYNEFADGIGPDDIKLHLNNAFVFKGGWRGNVNFFIETFRYPDALYANTYMLQSGAGIDSTFVKFTGVNRISNYDVMFQVATPQFDRWSFNGFTVLGRDENFDEWAPGWIAISTLNASYRPTDKLRADLSYNESRTLRVTDRSTVNLQRVPRLKVEYQISRPIFVRFVGQYSSSERDALRDVGRTEQPLYTRTSAGSYVPLLARSTNGFRADWLLSFQPTPGTVLFAGYGSSLVDQGAFAFRDVTRTSDGFFLKFSYLFRM